MRDFARCLKPDRSLGDPAEGAPRFCQYHAGHDGACSWSSATSMGWWEEYRCGCISDEAKTKRELPGYCSKHGESRKVLHPRLRGPSEGTREPGEDDWTWEEASDELREIERRGDCRPAPPIQGEEKP